MAERGASGRRANTFFALVPPVPARRAIAELQRSVGRALPASVRAVDPDNYHLTLVFLGAVPDSALPDACAAADGIPMPPARLVLDRLGAFPRARVGWLGCAEAPAGLVAFRKALLTRLGAAGFPADRRDWVPHLTLYRDLRSPLAKVPFDPPAWRSESFVLMRTRSGHRGPSYEIRGRWPAGDGDDFPRSP